MTYKVLHILLTIIILITFTACSSQPETELENSSEFSSSATTENTEEVESKNVSQEDSTAEIDESNAEDFADAPLAPLYVSVNKSEYSYAELEWSFDDGTLTFSGEGKMPDGFSSEHPWNVHAEETTKIVIGEGLISVGQSNFYDFYNLTEVSLPSTLVFIEETAFAGCYDLTTIDLPEGLIEIGNAAFEGSGLVDISLPSTLVKICDDAFFSCGDLASIVFPDSLRSIGESAFYSSGLTQVTIPEGVVEIGEKAFTNWVLTDVKLYASAEDIPNIFAANCPAFTSFEVGPHYVYENGILYNSDKTILIACIDRTIENVTIPESVTKIAADAFNSCENITSITLSGNIQELGNSAFISCHALSSVSMEDGLTTVHDFAFAFCENLSSLTFPQSVTYVGYGAFRGCNMLSEVIFKTSQSNLMLDENDIPETVTITYQ